MAYNSSSMKSKAAAHGSSLRITPSNSPGLRPPPRTPNKLPLHQSTLSLQTVIGTTTTTPNGFSSHDQSKSFALCAGSAAVLAEVDEEGNVNQRFFRARPSVSSINPVSSFYNQSTPPSTPDARARSMSSLKPTIHGNAHNSSPSSELAESNSPRPWSSRERVKAVTSVSISPNGRFLAVGETGYNPRVLIFSTAKDAPCDIPLSILTEHTFGVRGLSFSPDSQNLATLGDVNDGFLFIWSVNLKTGSAKLHSTNKCTSYVRDMCWAGQALITAGVRYLKVWRLSDARPGSPSKSRLNVDSTPSTPNLTPKALSGRNCLLGPLAECTFTSVASISDHEVVVGTDTGALCFLDDTEGSQKLLLVQHMDFGITSLTVDGDRSCVWIGGRDRRMQHVPFEILRSSTALSSPDSSETSSIAEQKGKGPAITCMGSLSSHLVTVDATKAIHIYPIEALSENDAYDEEGHMGTTLSAHKDAVLGICPLRMPNDLKADFFTWSKKGAVNFWDIQGKCQDSQVVSLDQVSATDEENSNELKVLRATESLDYFVSGDKLGVIRVLHGKTWECMNEARAHGAEITDIALHSRSGSFLVASCGRDRMVQLFEWADDSFQLIQTMDDHVGAVSQLLFIDDGEKLLSCSSDRTILIRDRVTREGNGETAVAYLISKVITLKASPVSMALSGDDANILVVSTVDRCIHQYDIASGRATHSFRAADSDSNDTVVMGALTVADEISGQSPKLLLGVSATDKSIRVYDLERGALLTGEFGHTEGVSDVCLLDNSPSSLENPARAVVTSGIDGVVMIWNISVHPHQSQDRTQAVSKDDDDSPSKESTTLSRPPLRKILSKSELAGYQKHENSSSTPTPMRGHSPHLIRKLSRFSLHSSGKHGNSVPTTPTHASRHRSPASGARLEKLCRTPSPRSPTSTSSTKTHTSSSKARRSSQEFKARARNSGKSDIGSLDTSTEQVCRTLRAYRKKLNGSAENIHSKKELERELGLTLRILNSRAKEHEHEETETESSSGKENERIPVPPVPDKRAHTPRRMPSTPNLGQRGSAKVTRSRSLDADGEG